MNEPSSERVRVLPGARFTCHGDGLCCSDVHALGPVSETEAELLVALHPKTITPHGEDQVLSLKDDGTCLFLDETVGCGLHAQLGPRSKPRTCQQFPFRIIQTPTGTRLSTAHLCPCRTLGEREALTSERADGLPDRRPDRIVSVSLPWDAEHQVSMADWEVEEASLFARLHAGETVSAVLGAQPELDARWQAFAEELLSTNGEHRFAAALRMFGAALLDHADFERPAWHLSFQRAVARSPDERDPAEVLRDWVMEELWSLEWAFRGTYQQARRELVVRAAMATRIASRLTGRPDAAMAEAVSVVDLVGLDDGYRDFVGAL
ncbi:MAG: YkgJ family cysteine cluster protein [Sandaracinaceae bacterium]